MIYGWAIDGNSNLNIFLAKMGGVRASALTKFIEYKDIEKAQRHKYQKLTEDDLKSFISKKENLNT